MAALFTSKENPTAPSPLIRLRGVSKVYSNGAVDFPALKNVDLDVQKGEFLGIVGKSGAGKTTLVNMISGVDHLTAGEVRVGEVNVHSLNENRLARWRGQTMGIVYQSFYLLPGLSLLNNVMLPMDLCGNFRLRESREKAMQLLRAVGLEHHAAKLPAEVSGGQQQRVAIARALANDPQLILADEPTGRLDSRTAEHVFEIFQRLVDEGRTILMVTHDRTLIQRVSRSILIQDGELVNSD